MSDKNIKIGIGVTGAPQAAAEIERVEKATKDLDQASDAASRRTQDLDANVSKIGRAQTGQAVAQLAEKVGMIGSKMIEVAADVREFDAVMADRLENTGRAIQETTAAASTMAMGFAVGGPLGAGIAGIITLLGKAGEEFIKMRAAQESLTNAEAQAVEMNERLQRALANYTRELQNNDAADRLKEQADAASALADQLERVSELERARAQADAAARDRQDAARIRAGEAPEDVQAQRARDDAAAEKAAIDAEIDRARARDAAAAANSMGSRFEAERLENDPTATPKAREDARRKAEADLEAARRADDERIRAEAIGAERRRGVDERAAGTVERLEAQKVERLRREALREAEKQERERERAEDEARRRREQDLTGQAESAEGRLDATARRFGTSARDKGLNTRNSTLAGIGKSLMDGTDAGELQRIGDLIAEKQRELGAGNVQALRTVLAELQKQAAEIAALKGQIKQSRAGK